MTDEAGLAAAKMNKGRGPQSATSSLPSLGSALIAEVA